MARRLFNSALTFAIAVGVLGGIAATAQAVPLESWEDQINTPARFKVLSEFNHEAVLDKETQLVWERSPATTTHIWTQARFPCPDGTTGGRKGWRLPSIHELASLIDPSVASPGPTLPPGHPFLNVQSSFYWSATSDAGDPTHAWFAEFFFGSVSLGLKTFAANSWCVRGGMNADQY